MHVNNPFDWRLVVVELYRVLHQLITYLFGFGYVLILPIGTQVQVVTLFLGIAALSFLGGQRRGRHLQLGTQNSIIFLELSFKFQEYI